MPIELRKDLKELDILKKTPGFFSKKIQEPLDDKMNNPNELTIGAHHPICKPVGDFQALYDVQSQVKFIEIRSLESNSDQFTKLTASCAARFYRAYLKKYRFFRWLWSLLWQKLYLPVATYINWLTLRAKNKQPSTYKLVRTKEWLLFTGSKAIDLLPASITVTPRPEVYPKNDASFLKSPHDKFEFPSVFSVAVENALIVGCSNIVFVGKNAICHDLYNFSLDYTSEELHGRHWINLRSGKLRMCVTGNSVLTLPEAAGFLDACSTNYAHWMTEVLPRISAFCADEKFIDVPLIVDSGLHKNILSSLSRVSGNRTVFQLDRGVKVKVKRLHLTSVTGYVPFERRVFNKQGYSHGLFSGIAFNLLRNKILSDKDLMVGSASYPSKVYIRRKGAVRTVSNITEIEDVLFAEGYDFVEPEVLNFEDQVRLFMNADSIVASSGAALANIIFAKPTAKIVIMIGKDQNTSYWYWQNIACAVGCRVAYVLGDAKEKGIHSDFYVPKDAFISAITGN